MQLRTALALTCLLACHKDRGDVMTYRGEDIPLSRSYPSYEEYANDPQNLSPEARERVRKIMTEAKIAVRFKDRDEVAAAIMDL